MIFHKSTQQIVKGKEKLEQTSADSPGKYRKTTFLPALQAVAQKLKKCNMKNVALLAAILFLGILTVTQTYVLVNLAVPRKQCDDYPKIPDGYTVAEITSDILPAAISSGDIVRLYTYEEDLPELRYVEVFGATEHGLLVLLDKEQSDIFYYYNTMQASLICRQDPERAAKLLDLQRRIRKPEITLDLPKELTLQPGEALMAEIAAAIDPAEAPMPQIHWESSDESVATVEKDGTITANAVGSATIQATCGNVSASCTVNVIIPLEGITLSKGSSSLGIGEKLELTVKAAPDNASDFAIGWASSDSSVATVSPDGVVTGVSHGQAVITAACNDLTASCTVTVGEHAEIAQLDTQQLELAAGESHKLQAAIYPSDAIDIQRWSTSDASIATVSKDGTVTAVAAGQATITFTIGTINVSCTVTVS